MVSLSRLVTPQRTLIMLPAVWAAMVMLRPDLLARLLLQLICYLGSLFEPFDGLLPQHGLLRVRQPATPPAGSRIPLAYLDAAAGFDTRLRRRWSTL